MTGAASRVAAARLGLLGRSRACLNGNRAPRRLIGFAHAHSRPPGAPAAAVLLCELRWGNFPLLPPCGSVLSFSAAATAVGDRDVLEPHGSFSAQVSADAAVAGGDGRGIADDHRGGLPAAGELNGVRRGPAGR